MFWEYHIFRIIQAAPGLRAVEGMMRVGKRRPQTKGLILVVCCQYAMTRSAIQVLECQAAGNAEYRSALPPRQARAIAPTGCMADRPEDVTAASVRVPHGWALKRTRTVQMA